MRIFFIITLSLLVFSITRGDRPKTPSKSIDWSLVHNLTLDGINHLYDLNIDSAMQSFSKVSRMAPGDPRGPFFESMVHFYLYGLNRDEKELSLFFDESEKVIAVCEDLLDNDDRDATTKFYLGGIYGYRGLAYQTDGSVLKAVRDGRKGYLLLEEAVTEKPDLYDAHMGFGLFRYLLAKLPKSMRWVFAMLGFEGDLEGGLRSLQLAAQNGIYTKGEAKLFLAQFLFSEGRRDSALHYLNELRNDHPENTLFMVLNAAWQHRIGNYSEALSSARSAIELNKARNLHYGEDLAYSTLGSIYFTLNDFQTATNYYKPYLTMIRAGAKIPNHTLYRAGVACEISGDRQTALAFYRRMKTPDDQYRSWDGQNYRRGQDLLRQRLSETEGLLIRAANESSQKNNTLSMQIYRDALKQSEINVDFQARALYGIQQCEFDEEMYDDAIATAQRLLALRPPAEEWVIPHAWFKLGQTYARLGRTTEARSAFKRVDDYDDYDFQDRLERQTSDELNKLKSGISE